MQTPIRPIGSFYRMVYSSSSGDDEDNVPLVQLKRTAFEELMPTPIKVTNKTPTVRKKAINYRGTPVTKDLFNKIKKINKKTSTVKKRKTTAVNYSAPKDDDGSSLDQERWYCYGCEEDRMAHMRTYKKCGKWYHEECVGLTEDDADNFECPGGC